MNKKERVLMSYVAGVMDGDGSFSLCKRIEDSKRSPIYYPFIQLGSVSEGIIDFFVEIFGGRKMILKSKTGRDGVKRKEFFSWRAERSAQCLRVLDKICEFLIIKKERALFLREYISNNPFIRGSRKISHSVLDQREFSYRKMKNYNDSMSYSQFYSKKTPKLKDLNEEFWSYLAGIIDTDGSFSIRKMKPREGRKSFGYSPIISISMNDTLGLNHIRENCPYGSHKTYKTKNCVQGFFNRWSVQSSEECVKVLNLIIPYLTVKKENAKVLLSFCENRSKVLYCQGSIPSEELEFRESCYAKLVNLNKYGVYKPSLIDLEALQGDRAEGASRGERLSEKASKEDATV